MNEGLGEGEKRMMQKIGTKMYRYLKRKRWEK